MDNMKNALHGWYKSTVEYVTPINEKSEFKEKGVLTPEEFLKAGCQLVYRCPTWSWEGGDKKKRRAFLPDNQQYLISRNLPCLRRVKALMISTAKSEQIVENGEWLNMEDADLTNDPNHIAQEIADIDLDAIDNKEDNDTTNETKEDDTNKETQQPLIQIQDDYAQQPTTNEEEDIEDADDEDFVIPDIEDFDDEDNVVSSQQIQQQNDTTNGVEQKEQQAKDAMFKVNEKMESKILKTRTYDVSITYDKYYRVPRVWLRGYDENGNPLSSTQIFEDISADHAHKTVTVEPHIHTGIVAASIHPCRHSEVMKRFMTKFEESGKQMSVDGYMFLFLKFMSAVIPTIQYDFTQSVDSST